MHVHIKLHFRFNTCSSCEEQPMIPSSSAKLMRFNTCSSCEEQPVPLAFPAIRKSFNTCSSCEEQLKRVARVAGGRVSIHAPLARSNCNGA